MAKWSFVNTWPFLSPATLERRRAMSGAQRALAKLRKAVYAEETLNSLLCDAARTAKPGKAARGAQYSKDQRTWANTLIRDKLHKCAAVLASSVSRFPSRNRNQHCKFPRLRYASRTWRHWSQKERRQTWPTCWTHFARQRAPSRKDPRLLLRICRLFPPRVLPHRRPVEDQSPHHCTWSLQLCLCPPSWRLMR